MVTSDTDKEKREHEGGEGDKEETVYGEGVKECLECGSKDLIRDYGRAEIFCANCGLVVAEKIIDHRAEWRAFDFEQVSRKKRVGAPMTYRIHDKGLGTLVRRCPSSRGHYKLKKLQQVHMAKNAVERSFIFALSEIDRMACTLRLPRNIRESASVLYRKAVKKQLIRGRSIEGIVSAILYITCRQYGVPRTLEEIQATSRVGQKEISRAYRLLLRELYLKVSPASPIDFVPRFCSSLNLSSEVQPKAMEITKRAEENEIANGRAPIGIAAAAIYIAAILGGEHRTQKEVSAVTGVTEVTIRNRYKELSEHLDIDMIL